MYSVVGCKACSALWVVADRPQSSTCPRCGKRYRMKKLKAFVETDDEDAARQARASMLAQRSGQGDAFADLDDFASMESQLDDVGYSEDEYLEQSGIDPDEVADAAERATAGRAGSSQSRQETVRSALTTLDEPDEAAVVAYAAERGVPATYTRTALEKLRRTGELTERNGVLRLV